MNCRVTRVLYIIRYFALWRNMSSCWDKSKSGLSIFIFLTNYAQLNMIPSSFIHTCKTEARNQTRRFWIWSENPNSSYSYRLLPKSLGGLFLLQTYGKPVHHSTLGDAKAIQCVIDAGSTRRYSRCPFHHTWYMYSRVCHLHVSRVYKLPIWKGPLNNTSPSVLATPPLSHCISNVSSILSTLFNSMVNFLPEIWDAPHPGDWLTVRHHHRTRIISSTLLPFIINHLI